MKKQLTVFLIIFVSTFTEAQFIKERSINAQIGFGLSSPFYSEDSIVNNGFLIQGEYVLKVTSFVEFRPYAGVVITNSDGTDLYNNPTDEKAVSKALLIGCKVRLRVPIPWVAPYFEIGVGTSIGSFETFTAYADINKNGLIHHIPYALGLELGRNSNFDLGFSYYVQSSVEQYVGAFAVGVTIPLDNKNNASK